MKTYEYIKSAVATLRLPYSYDLEFDKIKLDAHKKRFEAKLRSDQVPYDVIHFVGKSNNLITALRAYTTTTKITEKWNYTSSFIV